VVVFRREGPAASWDWRAPQVPIPSDGTLLGVAAGRGVAADRPRVHQAAVVTAGAAVLATTIASSASARSTGPSQARTARNGSPASTS
jgi:hypothetical protein